MNTTTDLDDFDRDLVRALRAKADQILVDDSPFNPEARPAAAIRLDTRRPRRAGRVLAAAAAVAVLVGGVAAVYRMDSVNDRDEATPLSAGSRTTYTSDKDGVAAFLPAALPPGWALQDVTAGHAYSLRAPETWQLFGEEGTTTSAHGVVVSSGVNAEGGVVEGATHTVNGRPVKVGPSPWPLAPAGALQASWQDGDIIHDSVAVGMTEAELVAFIESLTPLDDPATGFAASAASSLAELDTVTVAEQFLATAEYTGPGADDVVAVTTEAPDRFGGLLNRLAGEPGAGGHVLRGDREGQRFVTVARDDGWSIQITAGGSTVDQQPALLDELLAGMRPATPQQVIDIGLAEPVTATGTVGGRTVDIHGTDAAPVAMCLTPDTGDRVCTTAEDWLPVPVTTGSALVDGQWVFTVVSDTTFVPTVRPAPNGATEGPFDSSQEAFDPERAESGDQVIQVFTVPAGVDTIGAYVDTVGGQGMGMVYARPAG
jgi:hypothetical protein